jgi:putative SOS response-associated peptidase YedK
MSALMSATRFEKCPCYGLSPLSTADIGAGLSDVRGSPLPSFRDAYRGRCIVPVDGFFEWKAIKGQRAKQPYAIAMKDGSPFGLAGIWENWKDPASGEWIRTFAIITTESNELVADIHDRMPVILTPADYACWLGEEPDPRDLMRPFPAEPMRMWPISTRVNKPDNDAPRPVQGPPSTHKTIGYFASARSKSAAMVAGNACALQKLSRPCAP